MKYRVIDKDGYYYPTYFKTVKAAKEFAEKANFKTSIQRKCGNEWINR